MQQLYCCLQDSGPGIAKTLHTAEHPQAACCRVASPALQGQCIRQRCGEVASRSVAGAALNPGSRVGGMQPEDPGKTLYPCRQTGSDFRRNQAAPRPGSGAHGAQRGEPCRPQRRQRPRQVVTLDGPAVQARSAVSTAIRHRNMLQDDGSAGCATGDPYPTTHTRTGSWSWSCDTETKSRTIERRT